MKRIKPLFLLESLMLLLPTTIRAEETNLLLYKTNTSISIGESLIYLAIPLVIIVICIGIIKVLHQQSKESYKKTNILNYSYKDKKSIDYESVKIFREIPCNGDIYYANVLPYLNNFNYGDNNIVGAMLLKFIREEKIFVNGDGKFEITDANSFENESEEKLYTYLKDSSSNNIFIPEDFVAWCTVNNKEYISLLAFIVEEEVERLTKEGLIVIHVDHEKNKITKVLDDKIYSETEKLCGLRKFFQEFSLIDDKEPLEVNLWEQYLMFACIVGEADKISSELKALPYEELEKFVRLEDMKKDKQYDIIQKSFISLIPALSKIAVVSERVMSMLNDDSGRKGLNTKEDSSKGPNK